MTWSESNADWMARADSLAISQQAFIGGRYVNAASGKPVDGMNPATARLNVKIANAESDAVD